MSQTVYRTAMRPGLQGMIADLNWFADIVSRFAGTPVAQVSTASVGTATNANTYGVTINEVTFLTTAGVLDTPTTLAAAIIALIQADLYVGPVVTCTQAVGVITITSNTPGLAFTITAASAETGTVTVAPVTANVTTSPIMFGSGLVRRAVSGTASTDYLVSAPAASTDTFVGVAVLKEIQQLGLDPLSALTQAQLQTGKSQLNFYGPNDSISVMRKGRIWVPIEQNVDPTQAVYCRYTQNGLLPVGGFRVDNGNITALAISTATWVRTDLANTGFSISGGVGLLQLN